MFKRLYVDNFKALVNFELALPKRSLFLGLNGTGKTSVFEAIDVMRKLMVGDAIDLGAETLTRWQMRNAQNFEIIAELGEHVYVYSLEVLHRPEEGDCQVGSETLVCDNGQTLFESSARKAQLYRDDGSMGSEVLIDWHRSALPIIAGRKDHKLLTRFVEWLSKEVVLCRINPVLMQSVTETDATNPTSDFSNFGSWWRHIHDEDIEAASELRKFLGESLPGFRGLEFQKISERARRLRARFEDTFYYFDELSDGQRVLIALSALLVYARNRSLSLFLDEPDNFVSIREIQPFFNALESNDHVQATLISHHPTFIDLMAVENGIVFRRGANVPVRVDSFQAPQGLSLTASELIARGHLDELE